MSALRYNHVTGAPGWLIRESRMTNGCTLITLQDNLGNDRGCKATDDKHDIARLSDELLEQPGVVREIGAGHTVGERLTTTQEQQVELQLILGRVIDCTLSPDAAAQRITKLFKVL
jgi:hypothetical protein